MYRRCCVTPVILERNHFFKFKSVCLNLMENNENDTYTIDSIKKVISLVGLDGKIFKDSIILDDTLIDRLNDILESYVGANEDYIKLIYEDRVLNTINIFKIDDDFSISDNIEIIQVIKGYKKYFYLHENNDSYNDDSYYTLFSTLRRFIDIDFIINTEYYELILYSVTRFDIGDMLDYVTQDIKNNYDIVLMSVNNYGLALQYASKDMKNNKNIVLAAVNSVGIALQYASDTMKNDVDIVMAAVSNDSNSLEFASVDMKNNYDVILAVIKDDKIHALKYAGGTIKNDKAIMLMAVIKFGFLLKYVSKNLKNDKDIVLAAVTNEGTSLRYASENMKDDIDIVLAAVANTGISLKYASENMKNNYFVVVTASENNSNALKYASNDIVNKICNKPPFYY